MRYLLTALSRLRRPTTALACVAGATLLISSCGSASTRATTSTKPKATATSGAVGQLVTGGGSAASIAGTPGPVSVTWGDSTGLVRWQASDGAQGYRVTLIRVRDAGIMEQFKVPASQRVADVQGIWPNERYVVAVQPVTASGAFGPASLSTAGQSAPISRATYNGFLDGENVSDGQVNANLWDVTVQEDGQGGAFVNNQLHYHLEAGNLDGSQTLTTMRARVPIDWTNRTVTIHGEVDLKGDSTQWFAASLSPQAVGTDRIMDLVDRFYVPRSMPQLELFDDGDGVHLLYTQGNGADPLEIGNAYPNPIGIANVRDELVWKVSTTHVTVLVDGQTAFDAALPTPLAFTHGYLSLTAESYPGNGGGDLFKSGCDGPLQACNIWHLDNWGFDAASGAQPTSAAYYAAGCGPYPSLEKQVVMFQACDGVGMGDTQDRTVHTVAVQVASASKLIGAAVVLEARGLFNSRDLQVSVNGGPWISPTYGGVDLSPYAFDEYVIPITPGLLRSGANTVSLRRGSSVDSDFAIANVQLETLASTPYAPPPLPPEIAPLGTWTASA